MPCTNEIPDPQETDPTFRPGAQPPTQEVRRKCRYLVNRNQPQAKEIEREVVREGLLHVGGRCPFRVSHSTLTNCPYHNK